MVIDGDPFWTCGRDGPDSTCRFPCLWHDDTQCLYEGLPFSYPMLVRYVVDGLWAESVTCICRVAHARTD